MSVVVNKSGKIVVTFSEDCDPIDDHHRRVDTLLTLLQQRSVDFTDNETLYETISLVKDMLPSSEQLKICFKKD